MNSPDSNPLFVILLFLLRCLVPLAVMLGISYLLRKFGFIKVPTALPNDYDDDVENPEAPDQDNGDYAHGKV